MGKGSFLANTKYKRDETIITASPSEENIRLNYVVFVAGKIFLVTTSHTLPTALHDYS